MENTSFKLSDKIKRTLLLFSGFSFLFSSCTTNPEVNFTGTLTGIDSDTLLVYIDHMNVRKHLRTDTIALTHNQFEIQVPDSSVFIRLAAKPRSPKEPLRMMSKPIFFFPGDYLKVSGDINDYTVSGSEIYDGIAECSEILNLEKEVSSLNTEFSRVYKTGDKQALDEIRQKVKAVYGKLIDVKIAYIKANPNSETAAYFTIGMKADKGIEAINLLSDEVKEGRMAGLIQKNLKMYEATIAKEKAKLNMVSGNAAPDFKLKDLKGKEVTLASFKGKHLLIDFWGTWCGWCIKGIPEMKKYYAKYSDQIEFLGICCNDTEKKWRQGVDTHKLPWVNVFEGDSEVTINYAIGGYPTKVLVDPNGKIIQVFTGETPDLYKKLDELFMK